MAHAGTTSRMETALASDSGSAGPGGPSSSRQIEPQSDESTLNEIKPASSPPPASDSPLGRAWEDAWAKHDLKLTPEQKETLLEKGASMQEVLDTAEELSGKQRKGLRYRISQIIRPFLDGIKQFERAIDSVAQVSPMFLGSVWAGVKILLVLATNFADTFERLAGILADAGRRLMRVEKYADLFADKSRMQTALSHVYERVIEICAMVIGFFRQKGIKALCKALWGAFERKLAFVISCLVDRTTEADHEALISFFETSQAENRALQGSIDQFAAKFDRYLDLQTLRVPPPVEQRARVLTWLDARDHVSRYESLQMQRVPGTGDWLLQTAEVERFLKETSGVVVWVNGALGCGKSVLACHAVENVHKSVEGNSALFYYFCSFRDPDASDMNTVLRSFVVQALEQKPELLPHIFATMSDSGEMKLKSVTRLLALLSDVMESFSSIKVIVDGLDECPDSVELVQSLLKLRDIDGLEFNLLFFSRENAALHKALDSHLVVEIQPEDTRPDLSAFLDTSVEDLQDLVESEEESAYIKRKLLFGAHGVFLWAKLVVESLKKVSYQDEVNEILRNLPDGLESAYHRLFDQLLARDAPRRELAIRTLGFIVVSRRPLSIAELDTLLAIRPGKKVMAKPWGVERLGKIIRELLGPVIRVTNPRDAVDLIHLSTKDFLTKNPQSPIDVSQAHESTALGCLTYLNYPRFRLADKDLGKNIQKYLETETLLEYAAVSWGHHLALVNQPSKALMDTLKQFLASPENVSFWLRALMSTKSESTGEAITNDLLLLESHMRKISKSTGEELSPAITQGTWLNDTFDLILERFVREKGEQDLQTLEWYAVLGKMNIGYDMCELYLRRAIKGMSENPQRGPDHPNTITTMLALGRTYWNMKRLDEAEEVLRRCVDAREAALGKDDPDTLEALSWLATVWRGKGQHTRACEEYERIIDALEPLFGRQNRVVMREIKMLGVARRHEGSYEQAEGLFQECLDWCRDALGEMHPDTVQAAKNLAMVFQMDGRLDEAEAIHRDVIAKQLEVTGEDAEYYISLQNLGETLRLLDRGDEAEPVLLEALKGKDIWHGKKHPHTKLTLQSLSDLYAEWPDLGDQEEKEMIQERLNNW